jgi:hypothetical protein
MTATPPFQPSRVSRSCRTLKPEKVLPGPREASPVFGKSRLTHPGQKNVGALMSATGLPPRLGRPVALMFAPATGAIAIAVFDWLSADGPER